MRTGTKLNDKYILDIHKLMHMCKQTGMRTTLYIVTNTYIH